jgi:hypothetical protein
MDVWESHKHYAVQLKFSTGAVHDYALLLQILIVVGLLL